MGRCSGGVTWSCLYIPSACLYLVPSLDGGPRLHLTPLQPGRDVSSRPVKAAAPSVVVGHAGPHPSFYSAPEQTLGR